MRHFVFSTAKSLLASSFVKKLALFFLACSSFFLALWCYLFSIYLPSYLPLWIDAAQSHPLLKDDYKIEVQHPRFSLFGRLELDHFALVQRSDQREAIILSEPRLSFSLFKNLLSLKKPSLTLVLPSTTVDYEACAPLLSPPSTNIALNAQKGDQSSTFQALPSLAKKTIGRALTHLLQINTTAGTLQLKKADATQELPLFLSSQLQLQSLFKTLFLNKTRPSRNILSAKVFLNDLQGSFDRDRLLAHISIDRIQQSENPTLLFTGDFNAKNLASSWDKSPLKEIAPALQHLFLRVESSEEKIMQWASGRSQSPLQIDYSTSLNLKSQALQEIVPSELLDTLEEAYPPHLCLSGAITTRSPLHYRFLENKLSFESNPKKCSSPAWAILDAELNMDSTRESIGESIGQPRHASNSDLATELSSEISSEPLSEFLSEPLSEFLSAPSLFSYSLTLPLTPQKPLLKDLIQKAPKSVQEAIQKNLDLLRATLGISPQSISQSNSQSNSKETSKAASLDLSQALLTVGAIEVTGRIDEHSFQSQVALEKTQIQLGSKACSLEFLIEGSSSLKDASSLDETTTKNPSPLIKPFGAIALKSSFDLKVLSSSSRLGKEGSSLQNRGVKARAQGLLNLEQKKARLSEASLELLHGFEQPSSILRYDEGKDFSLEKQSHPLTDKKGRAALTLSLDPLLLDRLYDLQSRTQGHDKKRSHQPQVTFSDLQLKASLPEPSFIWKADEPAFAMEVPGPFLFFLQASDTRAFSLSCADLDLSLAAERIDSLQSFYDSYIASSHFDSNKALDLFLSDETLRFTAKLQELHLPNLQLDSATCLSSHSLDHKRVFECRVKEALQELNLGFSLSLYRDQKDTSTLSGDLSNLKGTWRGKSASLMEPIALSHSKEGLSLSLNGLELDGGLLHLNCQLPSLNAAQLSKSLFDSDTAKPSYSLSLKARQFPLDLLSSILPYGVQGRLDSTVDLSLISDTPSPFFKGSWQASLYQFSLERDKKHSFFKEISFEGGIDADEARLRLLRHEKEIARFSTKAPSLHNLATNKDSPSLPLNVHCHFDLQLSQIVRLFLSKDFALEGNVKGEMDFPLSDPMQARGKATVQKASFSYKPLKIDLFQTSSDIAQVQILPYQILIPHLKGSDHLEGVFDLNTQLDFKEYFSYSLKALTENLKLFESTHLKTLTTGELAFSGSRDGAHLCGAITLPKARAYIPSALPSSLPDLGDFEVKRLLPSLKSMPAAATMERGGEDAMLLRGPQEDAEDNFALLLDLNLIFPQGSRLVGRGLDSRWQGELALTGSRSSPLLHGGLHLTEGNLTFGGKRFTVQEGKLHFHGDVKKETRIHIVSEFPLKDVTIRAILQGPLVSPKLDFQSTPFMPLPDIFSQLLFRKNKEALSSVQALQVAQLALDTRGESPDVDLISKIRATSGIDVITVGSSTVTARSDQRPASGSGSSDPSLTSYTIKVGKYITPNLLLACTRDVSSQQTTLDVELDLTPQFSLIAEYDTVYRDAHLNLMWKKDY